MKKINQMNKKGLSDVVTTVLIILFAIVAVAVVGGIVLNQINKAGKNIDKAQLCTENVVEPVTCISSGTQSVVGLKRNSGGAAISSINLAFTKADGSVGSLTSTANPTNAGQAASATYSNAIAQNAKSVKATTIYTMPGSTETQACESKVFDCTAG